jgi:hypothetical protein
VVESGTVDRADYEGRLIGVIKRGGYADDDGSPKRIGQPIPSPPRSVWPSSVEPDSRNLNDQNLRYSRGL